MPVLEHNLYLYSEKIFDLGLIDFKTAKIWQKKIFREIKNGWLKSGLIICQHYPVITYGRSAKKENILVSASELKEKGIALYAVDRGGDVTYHGPGQLMIYPLVNLIYAQKDIALFLRNLEALAIRILAAYGVEAERKRGLTGVWVAEKKIASVGIAVKSWITYHGLAINIKEEDLTNFSLIRPCGMDIMMTSLETVLGREVSLEEVKERVIRSNSDG